MIFLLFLISVATLETILYREQKRSRDQAPPEMPSDDTRASLLSLADAVGTSVSPQIQPPQIEEPHSEAPLESGRRTDLH